MAEDVSMDMEMDVEAAMAPAMGVGAVDPALVIEDARKGVATFLAEHRADEVVPDNSRVLVLDGGVTLISAVRALLEHGARAAPVADSRASRYVALFTVSDVIAALLRFRYGDLGAALAGITLRQWAETAGAAAAFACADADDSLLTACRQLRDRRAHRLPIVAAGRTMLGTLEHWRVLRFVHLHLAGSGADDARAEALFSMSLAELGIGTFGPLVTVSERASLTEVLEVLVERGLSAVPIVDPAGKLRSVYCRTDVTALARGAITAAALEVNVMQALSAVHNANFRLATCRRTDTLRTVFEQFERTRKHHLYAVDDAGVLTGALSLSDVLAYFLNGV